MMGREHVVDYVLAGMLIICITVITLIQFGVVKPDKPDKPEPYDPPRVTWLLETTQVDGMTCVTQYQVTVRDDGLFETKEAVGFDCEWLPLESPW